MLLSFKQLKPTYISAQQVRESEVYLSDTIEVHRGRKYLVEAVSGKGKSSLLDIIYGVHNLYDGELSYHELHKSSLRLDQISYVFQNLRLFEQLTAYENVALKNELTSYRSKKEIEQLFAALDLTPQLHQPVKTLSLGQRQRVAIIRSLCMPFKLLLLDEPFSHLDASNITTITHLLEEELKQRDASMILTTLGTFSTIDAEHQFKL